MRTGVQSGTKCGCQAEVWVCVLVCASRRHAQLRVCTLVCTCTYIYMFLCYMSCYVYGCIFTSACIVFPPNTNTVVHIWGPCWVACDDTLFSGLPPPPPEPQIVSHPFDIWNVMGQDVIFGCEVFAYPMASIEWRKDGLDIQLPGDDPHISVQVGAGSRGFSQATQGSPKKTLLTLPLFPV